MMMGDARIAQIESELAAWEKLHNLPTGGGSRLVDDLCATNGEALGRFEAQTGVCAGDQHGGALQ